MPPISESATPSSGLRQSKYGNLENSCNTHHEYLRMNLDYSTPGQVEVSMKQSTQKILAKFPE